MNYSTFLKSSFSEPTSKNFEGYLLYHGFEKVFTSIGSLLNVNRKMDYRLTPLMMAVIFDRREALCFLLANKRIINLNAQDFLGYSALHHAAIKVNETAYHLLLAVGANPCVEDRYKGTPRDLYHQTHPGLKSINPIVYEGNEITPEKWEEITHSKYTEEMVVEPKIAEQVWCEFRDPSVILFDQEFVEERYREFCSNPPKIEFRNVGVAGNSAYLTESISKGAVVADCVGDYNPFDKTPNDYRFDNIVSSTYRGNYSLIQDGTPNLISTPFTAKGICSRALLIAVRDIKAGEPLYFNYGSTHAIKFAGYLELNGQKLREWIKGKNLLALKEKFKVRSSIFSEANKSEDLAMLRYLSDTPPVLLALFLEKIISKEEFLDLVSPGLRSVVSNNFNVIAREVNLEDTPRDSSYRKYVLKVLQEGHFTLASTMAANHKHQASLFEPHQAISDSFMNKLAKKLSSSLDHQAHR